MDFDRLNFEDENYFSTEKNFIKKYNNIYISEEQFNILKKYNIDVFSYKNVKQLIFDIEKILNYSSEGLEDLEYVSSTLSEYDYYNNTNK